MNKTATQSTFRAWSNDWNKSLTFTQDLINSDKWNNFKAYCTKKLGEGWGWELSSRNPLKSDIDHNTLASFVYPS